MPAFSKIMVMANIDGTDALRANTEIQDFGLDFDGAETLNLDPVANRRAMYSIAGRLAEAGYDAVVNPHGTTEASMWYEVFVPAPVGADVGVRETWEYNVRQVWDKACLELGLEYIG